VKKLIIFAIVLAAVLIGAAAAVLYYTINNSGTVIPSIPANVTTTPNNIVWGEVARGTTYNVNLTLTNTGDFATSLLQLTGTAPTGLTLTWNCTDQVLEPGKSIVANFILSVALDAPSEPFDFNMQIEGT